MQNAVTWSVKNKPYIVYFFQFLYFILTIYLVVGAQAISDKSYQYGVYEVSKYFGTLSILFFGLSIIPGMGRRFGIRNAFFTILMLFRRHLGIMSFALAFIHYCFLELFPVIFGVQEFFPMTFKFIGLLALFIMTILFFTSNDTSVQKMGKWWKRIHTGVYIVAWLIFGHVLLIGAEVQVAMIGVLAALETTSLIYSFFKKQPQIASS